MKKSLKVPKNTVVNHLKGSLTKHVHAVSHLEKALGQTRLTDLSWMFNLSNYEQFKTNQSSL